MIGMPKGMGVILTSGAVVLATTGTPGADKGDRDADGRFFEKLRSNESSLIEFRRDLHRHPELSGQEERTARVIAERMRAAGLDVRTEVGGHGVVAVLRGGRSGPVVAFRADMDAIPSTGPDPVAFASVNEGVRHGCGHDMHVAVAVGIAETFASLREEMPGTVKFIFQPAEENAEGAAAVIEDGAMQDPNPEAIFAVHCAPLEVGTIGSRPDMLLAGLDVVQVTLSGDGDVDAAAEAVGSAFAAINTVDPSGGPQIEGEQDFILAGVFGQEATETGGTKLSGMVRCSSPENHAEARAAVTASVGALDIAGVDVVMEYLEYAVPPVLNDPTLVERADATIRRVAGPDAVVPIDGVTPFFSEDFSHFQRQVPGVMYFLGVSNSAQGTMGLPHHPAFVADEGAIVFGAGAMAAVLWDYLEKH